jgi:putative membrane protein
MKKIFFLLLAYLAYAVSSLDVMAQTSPLTDAQIVTIIVDVSEIDIEAGKLAQFKSKDPEVHFFAHRMIADHGTASQSAAELMRRLKLAPQDSSISQDLKIEARRNIAKLTPLRGLAFDRVYVAHELAFHEQALDMIDRTLASQAKADGLKRLLAKMRPAFHSHLLHARRLQESLPRGGDGGGGKP